ncbi:MAG: secondary thiamine-phosphate synthase enzyme YjbQ [Patescibacteria group bacterium]
MVVTSKITINSTDQVPELIDITDKIHKVVKDSGVKNGQITVFSQHTTAALIIQENEEGIHKDLKKFLTTLVPVHGDYHHSTAPDHVADRMPNGHSHLQHFLLGGSSQVLPVVDGKVELGQFQSVFLVELDRARTRSVIVQVVGE